MKIPEQMTFQEAACVSETYITAYLNLFSIANLQDRQRVLLHGGGGGVNTAAVQLCKALVPNTTIIVTASAGKVEQVRELGTQFVINYQEQEFAKEVKRLTEGIGANVILDHIGASYLQSNMKALATGGTLVVIGVTGGAKSEINLALMMVRRQRVVGSALRSRSIVEKAEIISDFTKFVMPLMERREIVPLIYKIMPLEAASEAHRIMEASTHFGKIVLQVA